MSDDLTFGPFRAPSCDVTPEDGNVEEIVSLNDRKRIRELEAELTKKDETIAVLQGRIKPALERPMFSEEPCRHDGGSYVFDKQPRVTCKLCGCDLDPMTVLRKIAHQEMVFCYAMDHLKRERKELIEEVEKLKRVRNNTKRSIRRAETGK